MAEITYLEALREALVEEMDRDENVFCMGEDIGAYGGAFGVTRGMLDEFGPQRVRCTPISEATVVGAAIGAALTGHCEARRVGRSTPPKKTSATAADTSFHSTDPRGSRTIFRAVSMMAKRINTVIAPT